jgi:GTP cyclohydrolase I
MKITLQTIQTWLHKWAPPETAASWDNVGLQVGDLNQEIKSVLVSLDVDKPTLKNMSKVKPDLVITHHPIFFKGIRSINYSSDMGQILSQFFKTKSALLSAHTNLDVAIDGVNDTLIKKYGFDPKNKKPISGAFGKVIKVKKTIAELTKVMTCTIQGDTTRKTVERIGFCCGSGHGLVSSLPRLKIDCFITGEITYHDHVFCDMHNITVLTVGHKESEDLIVPVIKTKLSESFPDLLIY